MTKYFATCDIQGPISVQITANSLEEVLERIKMEGQQWIDCSRCDAEDAFLDSNFGDDWSNFSPEDISEEMEKFGYRNIYDSDIENCWIVWAKIIFDNS